MRLLLIVLFGILISSCGGKTSKWNETLNTCIASSDSTAHYFQNELSLEDVTTSIQYAEELWRQTTTAISADTLSLDFAEDLDAFNVAFHDAKNLATEYEQCKTANATARIRLENLKTDIANGAGNRSEYCASVQHEKEELTKIRNHCTDIRRRFEELKTSTAQFEQALARYSNE